MLALKQTKRFKRAVFAFCNKRNFITISPETTKVGWIGTGVMGKSMCQHLMKAGYKCSVFSRTKSKSDALVQEGATWRNTPNAIAQNSDVVFTMVGFPHDVRRVILGEDGVLSGLKKGGVIIDMTTSQPSLAQEIYQKANAKGCRAVDAPVSGGDVGAREARLSIMIGGDAEVVKDIDPLFRIMGKNIAHLGDAGAGQNTKMVNQILISTTMIGMVEGLIYGYKAGLNLEQVIKVVGAGAAGSWSINNYGPRILQRNFEPGFYVEHFIKDMQIALEESKRMNLKLPGLELAFSLYNELQQMGHSKKGTHALQLALEKMNNIEYKK